MSGDGFLDDINDDDGDGDTEPVEVERVSDDTIISPAASADKVSEMYAKFDEMKEVIIDSEDTTTIGNEPHINKSGWRKVATAFNISVEVAHDHTWTTELDDGTEIMKAQVEAKATAPNGKTVTALGVCASNESNFTRRLGGNTIEEAGKEASKFIVGDSVPENAVVHIDGEWRMIKKPSEVDQHNIITIASTRAKNRAISDLVGGGEVSAEEISAEDVL